MTTPNDNEPLALRDQPMTAWQAAEVMGNDMSLVERSLSRTPAERFREHNRVMRLAWELREAMRRRNVAS